MPRNSASPKEQKIVTDRAKKLQHLLSQISFGRLIHDYDPITSIHNISLGTESSDYGCSLFDGKLYLILQEQVIVNDKEIHIVAYRYQLSWPDNANYKSPNEWIFRFEFNVNNQNRQGFAGKPHLNIHHPEPVGPGKMHYPTNKLISVEMFFQIIKEHFPQKRPGK